MKALVIFYSLEGNTKLIAERIAKCIKADVLELKPRKDISAKGLMRFVWGGKSAMMSEKPELLPLDKDPNQYDVLFIGTPVWAWTYAPALNSFFAKYVLANKRIALFCCHGGGKGAIFDKMQQALKGNQIIGTIDFQDPLKHKTAYHLSRVEEWAEEITDHS